MTNLNMNENDDYPQHTKPLEPPAFSEPILDSCVRINSNVLNRNGTVEFRSNAVLVKTGGSAPFSRAGRLIDNDELIDSDDFSSSNSSDSSEDETEDDERPQENEYAYLICDAIHDAIYGKVYHGNLLRRSSSTEVWQMMIEECAIKAMTWDSIRRGRNQQKAENPEGEISAMQLIKRHLDSTRGPDIPVHDAMRETNVIMPLDFLFDDRNLYTITPYCTGGEMFDVLLERQSFSEPESRYLLRSILNGLESLQRVGLCHRDISLENILVDNERTFVIDMGMCLRVPFFDNEEGDTDMLGNVDYRDRGAQRCLISGKPPCGKPYYMSPEVYSEKPFDGYAIDMWAVGVCLFMMLTGQNPWERPTPTDNAFRYMSSGSVAEILTNHWHITLSADAMDLLQRMLFENPHERLSLQQVRAHPWMDGPMNNPMNNN